MFNRHECKEEELFRLEASPKVLVPGEETAVFVSKLGEDCCSCTGSSRLGVQLVLRSSQEKTLFRTQWEVDTVDLVEDSSRYQPNFGK